LKILRHGLLVLLVVSLLLVSLPNFISAQVRVRLLPTGYW